MQFTIRNHILALIEDKARFLEHLIEEYPNFLKEWTEKTDREFQQDAESYANGDPEVSMETYSSWLSAFDENESREDLFYKSMLLMTYAYYESSIDMLAKRTKTKDQIEAICKSNNIELSKEATEAKDDLDSNIRIIRNQLAHNNMGNPQKIDDLMRICKMWNDIRFSNDEIIISGSDFVLDSLKKELVVLRELCQKLGYKHKRVQTG